MTPKFIELTQRVSGKPVAKIMVNPRRIDSFQAQDAGAIINFGRREYLCVMETVTDIKRLLSK